MKIMKCVRFGAEYMGSKNQTIFDQNSGNNEQMRKKTREHHEI